MTLEQGDIVICTVEKIQGTTVFVNIEGNGGGSIVLSEIAPGRIRNLRDYVVPKKVIVCKVLRVSGDRVELSLRRVNQKEEKEAREQYNLENSYKSILKTVLKEDFQEVLNKIKQESSLFEFLNESKKNPEKLKKFFDEESAKKILSILNLQKNKKISIKKEVKIKTKDPEGIEKIKEIFKELNNVEVKYISAGRYSIKAESNDPKTAENKIRETLNFLEKNAKSKGIEFG